MRHLFLLTLLLVGFPLFAQQNDETPQTYPPMISKGVLLGKIPALRDLEPHTLPQQNRPPKLIRKRNYFFSNELKNPNPLPQGGDPLAKPQNTDRSDNPEIAPGFVLEGLRDPGGVTPPDPNGDVGKQHYVQMVNSADGAWFQVWDKNTGQSVYGPALTSTIWSQVSTQSFGDPIIQYDHAADRWLMLELRSFADELLLAISDNGDPAGGWKAYSFQTLGFPDYPKLYVWHNAYFLTANEIVETNECAGYALERAALLAGEPTFQLYRFQMPRYQGIVYQPATGVDWEGGAAPPPNSPGYILRLYDDAWGGDVDHLQVWRVFLNWQTPTESSLAGPEKLYPAPFETRVCFGPGLFDCIEQPDPQAPRITALENIIMHRAPYRNFGNYESVVLNHVADVSGQVGQGGDAAVRWYELRKTSGSATWQIHQQGTYAPDLATNRFTGTLSMDEAGNIGLGYTVCSDQTYPGLRLTGRRDSDPLGDLPLTEYELAAGEQSHYDERWGDYSSMTVDPVDGRTFWFTGEYQPAEATWGTRIGSFRILRDTFDIAPALLTAPVASPFLGNAESVKVQIRNSGIAPAAGFSVSLFFEGNLVATDAVNGSILPGASIEHTFSQTIAMPQAGKNYQFRVVTHWLSDQFTKNDTLNTSVQKLTSNDASLVGRFGLPGVVCGNESDFSLIVRNTSAVPMQSALIHWRINAQAWQTHSWVGNLAPGARDTVPLHMTGVLEGLNVLRAHTSLPNGLPDQASQNDTMAIVKFYGNLNGAYLNAEAATYEGALHWELRTPSGVLLSSGELSEGAATAQICCSDESCYTLALRASAFSWVGHFRLLDIFGNALVEAAYATSEETLFSFCTPERRVVDVGALALLSPTSSPYLTANEPITLQFRNFGLSPQSNLQVAYRFNDGVWYAETVAGPIAPAATAAHTFVTTENLSQQNGVYHFELKTSVLGDDDTSNDTIHTTVLNHLTRDLELLNVRVWEACDDPANAWLALRIRNNGLESQHNFDIAYSVNGTPQAPTPKQFTLLPNATTQVILYVASTIFGENTVELELQNLNGAANDQNPANDHTSISFDISPDGFPTRFMLTNDDAAATVGWQILNEQDAVVLTGEVAPFSTHFEVLCLSEACYRLRLFSPSGNGLSGTASLFDFDQTFLDYAGGDFGQEISLPFCLSNGEVSTQTPNAPARKARVRPNPTKGLVHIEIAAMEGETRARCEVFDGQGKFVQAANLARWDDTLHGSIALDTYPPGFYWLKINGLRERLTLRVLKQ
jgi:hypothetical protein